MSNEGKEEIVVSENGSDSAEMENGAQSEESASKASVFDMARAGLRGKAGLVNELSQVKEKVKTLKQANAAYDDKFVAQAETIELLEAQVEGLTSLVESLSEDVDLISLSLDKANEDSVKVHEDAVEMLASVGVDAADLPSQLNGAEVETLDSLRMQLESTSDPVERAKIAAKCRVLRNK